MVSGFRVGFLEEVAFELCQAEPEPRTAWAEETD